MLVLTRKTNESINIGKDIEIFIVEIKDDHVKIGIKAPKDVPIYRQEIYKSILEENELAASVSKAALESIGDALAKNFPEKA
ncbi:MAG: carbon storage regulator CsrA [Actinomycetota bacterium]|nr:carbon storage regulator CsrA [Actinomycetota bacterium]